MGTREAKAPAKQASRAPLDMTVHEERVVRIEALLLSVDEAARVLSFSHDRLYAHMAGRDPKTKRPVRLLTYLVLGGRRYFPMKVLRQFVANLCHDQGLDDYAEAV